MFLAQKTVARRSRKANRVGKIFYKTQKMKTKILFISLLSFLIKTAIAQPVSTPYATGIRLSDYFNSTSNLNPNTWFAGLDNDGGDIVVDNLNSDMLQFLASQSNGNVQYRQKLIPGLPSPFSYVSGVNADQNWRIQFDYTPISYSGSGTSHVLMALADNTVSPTNPPMTTALNNNTVSITPTNIVGVMLISAQGQPANSTLMLFAKRRMINPTTGTVQTMVYTSDGTIGIGGALNTTNIQTVNQPNTSAIAANTNGLAIPCSNTQNPLNYRIILERQPKINPGVYLELMQNINGGWVSLGRTYLALPDDALIANATATVPTLNRFICSNLPQGGNRILTANIDNLQISRMRNPSITASFINPNGTGVSYCQSVFPSTGVNFTAPQISPSASSWFFANGAYTVGVPVNVAKLLPPNGISGNTVFPYSHSFTFLPGNTLENFFTTTEANAPSINTNCRVSHANIEYVAEQMNLFPNPASNKLTLSGLTSLGIIHNIEILNMNGQSVQKTAIDAEQNELELNIAELPVGVYILRIDTENGQKVEKFAKE